MTLTNSALLDLANGLGITREQLVATERPDEIRHQFAVSLTHMNALDRIAIRKALTDYGEAFSLEFRTGDLIEISIDSSSTDKEIGEFLAGVSHDYDVVLRVNKSLLLDRLDLLKPSVEVRLFFFTDALSKQFRRGLTWLETGLWREVSRPLRVYVLDSATLLVGPWLSITNLSQPDPGHFGSDSPGRVERIAKQRDRYIGWDEQWVRALTPSHLRVAGESDHADIRSLADGQFIALAALYLCDRARSRSRTDGGREIRAEFRGQAHVAVVPMEEGVEIPGMAEDDLDSVASLVDWVYAVDQTIGKDWVSDRLPFAQTRVAQMLEGRPDDARFRAFAESAQYLVEGVEWQWKAFIEGRISAYLENRKELESIVGDTVVSFRERASELVKGLSDNILAAVGVLVGSFIAAGFSDPFNENLFRIGVIVYGIYVLVFPGAIGLISSSVRFRSARSDFDERMKSYKRLLGSEVDGVVGTRVADASRDYWIWTAVVAVLYVAIVIAAFIAADRVPDLIQT